MFGKLVGGEEVLDALEALPRKDGTERPSKMVRITEVVMCVSCSLSTLAICTDAPCRYQDPFEEYKQRLAKRLEKKAAAEAGNAAAKNAPADDMNWFGVRVGAGDKLGSAAGGGVGVGKYLASAKRPAAEPVAAPQLSGPAKKRKIGFGDFEGW